MTSKDSHDPGWNDPPIFTYDKAAAIQAAAASKKGISLNKRVAFPISSNTVKEINAQCSTFFNTDSSKPPPVSTSTVMSSFPDVKPEPTSKIGGIGSKERLEKILENLHVNKNCDEEIIKRIKILEKMWSDGKLGEDVQRRVYEMSEALAKNDTEAADRIQMGLMVDYVSQCSMWMSGIRHLINQKKSTKTGSEV